MSAASFAVLVAAMAVLISGSPAGAGPETPVRGGASDAAVAAVGPGDAQIVHQVWVDDRTLDVAIASSSHDALIKWVRLVVPASWDEHPDREYPTLWLLHGGMDNHHSWYDNTDIEELSADREAIIVMPETSWCSAYSDWWNYGDWGAPAWETYLIDEVRVLLEQELRANGTRAVVGISMGGLGSLKLAANNPGVFEFAASFSGNVDPLHSYERPLNQPPSSWNEVDAPGLACLADRERVWGDPTEPAGYDRWQANNPYDRAADLRGTELYIASGTGQNPWDPIEQEHTASRWRWWTGCRARASR